MWDSTEDTLNVDMSLHFIAVCLVFRVDDGLVNSSKTCSMHLTENTSCV